jgi:hypothetical protein
MKIRCKQKDGEIGLNGVYWSVEDYVADIPEDAAAILLDRYSDNFGVYEETNEEEL